jgi:hypothetical protein
MLLILLALAAASGRASAAAPLFLPSSAFTFAPADRWSPRAIAGGAVVQLSKWGSAAAIIASAVNATAPPTARRLGLVYGVGSSNGFLRVTVNGVVVNESIDTYNATTAYSSEYVVELSPNVNHLPNSPLWVLIAEATGRWRAGSKDSYVEVVGLNVYF